MSLFARRARRRGDHERTGSGRAVSGVTEKVGSTAYFRVDDDVIAGSRGYGFGCLSTNEEEPDGRGAPRLLQPVPAHAVTAEGPGGG